MKMTKFTYYMYHTKSICFELIYKIQRNKH